MQLKSTKRSILTHKAPIVSFIRACDNPKVNKSKLLNALFGTNTSGPFVTIDDVRTYQDKSLAKGMIEMYQYCPDFPDDQYHKSNLNDMVTILNLRGNAASFED